MRDQLTTIEQELTRDRNSWLGKIDAMWTGLENDLNGFATAEQAARGHLALGKPGRKLMDTIFIDQIIPTFDLVVGILLILGLFTRITSLAGAGFLAMIVATQWPGAPGGSQPTTRPSRCSAVLCWPPSGRGVSPVWISLSVVCCESAAHPKRRKSNHDELNPGRTRSWTR